MKEFSDYIVLIALTDVYSAASLVQMLSVFFPIVSVIVYLWFPAPEFDVLLFGCCHSMLCKQHRMLGNLHGSRLYSQANIV